MTCKCELDILFKPKKLKNNIFFVTRIGNLENDDTFTPFFQDTLAPSPSSFSNLAPPSRDPSPSFSPSSSSASFSSPFSSFSQSQSSELQGSHFYTKKKTINQIVNYFCGPMFYHGFLGI